MTKFFVIEGPDGTGKSTVISGLKERFKNRNILFFREPGGSPVGEKIREILLDKSTNISPQTEALLFAAMRSENYEMIKALPSDVEAIIADRFLLSSLCYQGYGLGLGAQRIEELNDFSLNGFRPDKYIVLMMPHKSSFNRVVGERELDRVELRGDGFFDKVEDGYWDIVGTKLGENGLYYVVDASLSKGEVLDEVASYIENQLK
ncbi:MAG: dTMP kinase [Ezakiella sp.]|nr:dTMP kinase [Ezakiella sp.]